MLEEVLRFINNRFDRDPETGKPFGVERGAFTCGASGIDCTSILPGQWFWVEGSSLNDGLHRYPAEDMAEERFEGRVIALRVPKAVADIADEVEAWNDANAKAVSGPYASESFGGYSYTLAQGGAQGNEAPMAAWQSHFAARLRPYRKLYRDWT